MIRCHNPDTDFRYRLHVNDRCKWDVGFFSCCMQPRSLPLTFLLHTYIWFVPLGVPLTHSSSVCYLLLTHLIFYFYLLLSVTPAPSIQYPLHPIRIVPFLYVDLCPLSSSPLFLCLFTLSLLPGLLPFSRSLPAMQTLKVNLHSQVLLLASATMTERFSFVPPLFSFIFFLFYILLLT